MSESIPTEIIEAFRSGDVVVCLTKCWPCQMLDHYDPPKWHPWADGEDIEHARDTGQPDPSAQRCGCACANAEEVTSE